MRALSIPDAIWRLPPPCAAKRQPLPAHGLGLPLAPTFATAMCLRGAAEELRGGSGPWARPGSSLSPSPVEDATAPRIRVFGERVTSRPTT